MEVNKVKELKATVKALGIRGYNSKADLIAALRVIELQHNINLLEDEYITIISEPIPNPLTREFFREMRKELEFWAIPIPNPLTIDLLWEMSKKFVEDDHRDMIFNARLGKRAEQRRLLILREERHQ